MCLHMHVTTCAPCLLRMSQPRAYSHMHMAAAMAGCGFQFKAQGQEALTVRSPAGVRGTLFQVVPLTGESIEEAVQHNPLPTILPKYTCPTK